MSANKPETVCYCTGSPQSYLKVNSNTKINTLNFNTTVSKAVVDLNGLNLKFSLFAQKTGGVTDNQPLISIPNYLDVSLVNNSRTIRANLYSKTGVVTPFDFTKHTFRFNMWTSYSIVVTTTSIILNVDSLDIDKQVHKIPLPASAKTVTLQTPVSLTYLVNFVTVSDSKARVAFNQTFTQAMLLPNFQDRSTSGLPL